MAFPRPSCLRSAVGRSTLRRAGQQARTKSFRNAGRRTYASGHEAKKSSDIPWIAGSLVVTVPAATWLIGQTPTKSDHGHGEEHVVEEGGEEEEPAQEESNDDGDDKPATESKEESKDDSNEETKEEEPKSDDSGSEDEEKAKDTPQTSDDEGQQEYEPPGPNAPGQINKSSYKKGPGEGQKGERKPTEKKGEKDAQHNFSGAQNPRMKEIGRSYKEEGVLDTAKIHGTVDPRNRSSKQD